MKFVPITRIAQALTVVALVLTVLGPLGCPSSHGVTIMPPKVTDQDMCPLACANLVKLGCEIGQPIDMGNPCTGPHDCLETQYCEKTCHVTCERFCRDTSDNGIWLQPECVSKVTSCDQVEACAKTKSEPKK